MFKSCFNSHPHLEKYELLELEVRIPELLTSSWAEPLICSMKAPFQGERSRNPTSTAPVSYVFLLFRTALNIIS